MGFTGKYIQPASKSASYAVDTRDRLPPAAEWQYFLKLYAASAKNSLVEANPESRLTSLDGTYLRHVLRARLQTGHRIRTLRNGDQIFPVMLDAIRSARRSIEFLFFIYWGGEIAERFCEALIERANAGVRVLVIFDGFGSKPMPDELRERFRASPVRTRTFHPVPHWKIWHSAARTHRKILTVDGVRAFTGGVGIAQEWTGNAEGPKHFRDTQFEIQGPVVADFRAAFFQTWAAAGGRTPEQLDCPDQPHIPAGVPAAVIASTGAQRWAEIALMFQCLVREAQTSLHIVTPYFVPGPVLMDELLATARRGVAIRIMTSGAHNDHKLSLWAGRRHYADLLEAGVELFEYDRTLLHTKAVVVDRRLSVIGSPNMNQRSQSLDDEIALIVADPELSSELLRDFKADLEHCRTIRAQQWPHRGFGQRLGERLASMLEAQL